MLLYSYKTYFFLLFIILLAKYIDFILEVFCDFSILYYILFDIS